MMIVDPPNRLDLMASSNLLTLNLSLLSSAYYPIYYHIYNFRFWISCRKGNNLLANWHYWREMSSDFSQKFRSDCSFSQNSLFHSTTTLLSREISGSVSQCALHTVQVPVFTIDWNAECWYWGFKEEKLVGFLWQLNAANSFFWNTSEILPVDAGLKHK